VGSRIDWVFWGFMASTVMAMAVAIALSCVLLLGNIPQLTMLMLSMMTAVVTNILFFMVVLLQFQAGF
jgi:hypothetical protein